ncbi:uncharacterized protein LOC142981698 [Anticarsia gemmatalis]|uniref:uncharacterized protein LOC142981698 n=1 Tax=Anticarsia gemmatalis TaxID=129554 RepID=UPI003F75ECC6
MAEEGILINLSEMIDLAIGTPEVGVVDFCMLQTVLHCLAQQLRVLDKNIELRGTLTALPVGRQAEAAPTIAINEFLIEVDGKVQEPEDVETILVVERITKGKAPAAVAPPKSAPAGKPFSAKEFRSAARAKSPSPAAAAGPPAAAPAPAAPPPPPPPPPKAPSPPPAPTPGEETAQPAVSATSMPPRQGLTSTEKLSLVTLSKFNLLETTVLDLKERVYGSIPKNEEILEEVRSQSNLKAITDMWTSLNVSSRLEAAEEGIGKLSSLVQDLVGETNEIKGQAEAAVTAANAATTAVADTAAKVSAAVAQIAGGAAVEASAPAKSVALPPPEPPRTASVTGTAPAQSMMVPAGITAPSGNIMFAQSAMEPNLDLVASRDEFAQLVVVVERLREDLDKLTQVFYTAMKEMDSKFEPPPAGAPPPTIAPIRSAMQMAPPPQAAGAAGASDGATAQSIAMMSKKLDDMACKVKQCCEIVFTPDGNLREKLESMQDQIEYYTKQFVADQSAAGGKLSPDIAKDLQGLMQLFQTVNTMQTQLSQVHETALQLAAEKEDRQHNINALLEQIELLKAIKLDREDMVEALADKADLRMLARKVSHDQFEMACDDLSRGLEHALGKLNVQESLWQQALDDIQREIETKLDKIELSPVKEFFNAKLKQLQENLKQMAALRREAEAAGTKKRLLSNVNCISCDAKAVMNMEPSPPTGSSKPLPATMSMKPYLSYELDAIRKSQASNLPQRNMHDWENIDKQMTAPPPAKAPQKVRSETDKHLCNRYCGGSHTTTTPAQRVARLGHFIRQWGPEVLPLSSAFATGDDGRLYKVSGTEGANVGPGGAVDAPCTPKSAPKKAEPPKPQRPPPFNPDCRCLDDRAAQKD